jgi:hypothetical protein
MIGTSQKSPIVVPNAAISPIPYMAIAVAIAISKWLDDPIITVTIASRYFSLVILVIAMLYPTTITNPSRRGMDTNINRSGLFNRTFPFIENNITSVVKRATIDIFPMIGLYLVFNQSSPLDDISNLLLINPNTSGSPIKMKVEITKRIQFTGIF